MTTINPLIMTMPSGTAAQGTATGAGAAAGGSAFSQMLVQVVGAAAAETSASVLPDLTSLLANLLSGMTSEESAAILEESGSEVLAKLVDQLADNPELLEQHIGDEDLQSWLAQAAMLLQGMQLIPVTAWAGEETAAGESLPAGETGTAAPAFTTQQAQVILKQFVQAVNQHPDEIFLNQLQEKLTAILTKSNQPEQALPVHASQTVAGGTTYKPVEVVYTQTSSAASRLEMLAAKHMPIQLSGTGEQASSLSQNQSETGEKPADSQEGPFSVIPNHARLAAERAPAANEVIPVRAGQLAEDISKFVLGKLRVQNANGLTEARLSLTPEALGHVDVRLTLHNGQLVAQFAAQTALGKDALESQLAQLRNMLQNQGIQVEKIEVAQSASLQSSMFQDPRGQQQPRQSSARGKEQNRDGNEEYATEAAAILRKQTSDDEGFDVIA